MTTQTNKDLYINHLNGCETTPPSLVNYSLLEYCNKKHKDLITDCDEAEKIMEHQRWTEWIWNHDKRITTPKYIYHVDFELFMGREYPTLLNKMILNAQQHHRNIVTSIHLDAFQSEEYYKTWCQRLDKFLVNNERNQVFDYLNIYIEANDVELADLWLNAPVYTAYSNVFDVVKLCSSLANLTKVNVLYAKSMSRKTGRPVYDNILNSNMGFGWPLNLYNKHRNFKSQITLTPLDDGKTSYIKNIHTHMSGENIVKQLEINSEYDVIEFDSRMIMLPGAVKVGSTRYCVQLTPRQKPLTWTARLSALLPWLRSYVSQ